MVKVSNPSRISLRNRRAERGYVLLSLMLVVTLMMIFAAVAASSMAFEIKREREMEMIHRGVQYSRAIRGYYKKFGRYPTRLEDLDNTNNLRYLRKHYKDPLNKNKDFKLLHYGDPGVTLTGSVGSTAIPGANTVGQLNAAAGNSAFGGGQPGGSSFGQSSFGQPSSFGGNSNSAFGGNSGSSFGGSSGGFGQNSNSSFGSSNNSNPATGGSSTNGSGTNQSAGTDPAQASGGAPQDPNSPQSGTGTSGGQGSNQVFGGGPIVGVASISKETTVREYNKKKKYNEWQFVYDPTMDRGGLITTPNQPALQLGSQNLNGQNGQPGQPGTNGTNNSPFGGSGSSFGSGGSSFGQSSGFGNSNSNGGSNPPPPPQSSPNNN